jgi:TatD DNase family protein
MVTLLSMKIMIITDTHTHLYSEEFDQDRTKIQRAIERSFRFFIPAIDSSCTAAMYDLEKNWNMFSNDGTILLM